MKSRRTIAVVSLIAALLIAVAWYQFGGDRTPRGQPQLTNLNLRSLDRLRADFNAAADRPRMIVLLSPT